MKVLGGIPRFTVAGWLVLAAAQRAETASVEWDARFGGGDADVLFAVQQTADGGYIAAGHSASGTGGDKTQTSRGSDDYWIVKLTASGAKQWDARFGGADADLLSCVQQTADGGYILGGYSSSGAGRDKTENSRGSTDYWIVKTDSNGVKQWDARFGGTAADLLYALQQTADGGYILGGYSTSNAGADKNHDSRGAGDYWIVKADTNGLKRWDMRFGGLGMDVLSSLQQTADGGYILGGSSVSGSGGDKTQDSRGNYDYWIVKTDADGNRQWDARFGGSDADSLYIVRQMADGGYILGGYSVSGANGDRTQDSRGASDYWIVKTDAGGIKQWDVRFGGDGDDWLYGLSPTRDGGFIAGGYSSSGISGDRTQDSRGGQDYWIVRMDAGGRLQWDARFGGSGDDRLCALQPTADSGYVLAGSSLSPIGGDKTQDSRGAEDYWVLKIASLGPWTSADDLGGGWKWLGWFGSFHARYAPWIYHSEHGWMYCLGDTLQSLWLWTSDLGWLWTSETTYPFLYRADASAWLWYLKGSRTPRTFYNFTTALWEEH